MEFFKSRKETKELLSLRILNARMNLSKDDSIYYWNLEKGFEGEKKFDEFLETLPDNCLILNDLLLEVNRSRFQIDSLLIFSDAIFPIDVKNHEGDVILRDGRWYSRSGKEIKNQLYQLQRSESLLRQLLQEIGYTAPLKPYLVFVNPDFYMYQASIEHPIIFPSQINRFIEKLSKKHSKVTSKHKALAKTLVSRHSDDSPYLQEIEYSFDQLKKGMICLGCNSFNLVQTRFKLVCNDCGYKEDLTCAVIRNVQEIQLLFPDMKITTNIMHEWCDTVTLKTIRRILIQKYKLIGHGKSAYFNGTKEL